ncbi:hypothetical protein BV25DRAFT_1921397 [Artomyces pyxidatus]|uniref:Uncharacterized protein n=1 Tax=Artomyces pyxidatus TaxID=48021 RepID=A0ACB8SIL9_9AGAM|nr:hypothetical protein BV25DRAFT_1921397 [Artomyces pyxidatus]
MSLLKQLTTMVRKTGRSTDGAQPPASDRSANPSSVQRLDPTSFASANLNASVAILKEVGELTIKVPYLKSAAGVLLRIIEIKDEVELYRDSWKEVMEDVKNVTNVVLETYELWTLTRDLETFRLNVTRADMLQHIKECSRKLKTSVDACNTALLLSIRATQANSSTIQANFK